MLAEMMSPTGDRGGRGGVESWSCPRAPPATATTRRETGYFAYAIILLILLLYDANR